MSKYRTRVELGKDANGNRIRKWAYGDTKPELERNIRLIIAEHEKNENPSDITFKDYSRQWFNAYKSGREAATRNMYDFILGKFGALDPLRVRDIRQTNLQMIITDNQDSPRVCEQIRMTLRQIFRVAVQDGIIVRNPAAGLEIPRRYRADQRALTEKELKAIRRAQLDPQDRMWITILFYFGLRPGEALALMPQDFDFRNNILHIRRSIGYNKNSPYIKTTKTGDCRDLPIPVAAIRPLRAYLRTLETPYLFTMRGGYLVTKTSQHNMWKRIRAEINRKLGGNDMVDATNGLRPYTFRHNYCTMCYYSGISLKKCQELMGHHTLQMIMQVYAHLDNTKEPVEELRKMTL